MSSIYDYPGDISSLYNGNLLVNPDFKINQKNIKDITVITYSLKDIADKWQVDNAPMGKCRAVQNEDSTISFANYGDEDGAGLTQLVQRGVIQEGETYCISANITAYIGKVKIRLVQASYPYSELLCKEVESTGITSISAELPTAEYEGRYNFNICCDSQSAFTVAWCKLELGSRTSNFESPDYYTEILKIGEMNMSFSNPNLLYNPDFKINQRSESSYSSGYTVDRWALAGDMSLEVVNEGIKLTSSSMRSYLCQPLNPSKLLGKKIVFSCSVKVESGYWYAQIRTTDQRYNICRIGNKSGIFKVIAEVPLDTTQIQVRILSATNDPSSITVYWTKLEIGGQRSLFVPPVNEEELVKCKEYYAKYYSDSDMYIPGLLSRMGDGKEDSVSSNYSDLVNASVELPIPMNGVPKMSTNGDGFALSIGGQFESGDIKDSNISIDSGSDTVLDMPVKEITSSGDNMRQLLKIKAEVNEHYSMKGVAFSSYPIYLVIKPGSYIAFDAELELEKDAIDQH